MFEYLPKEPKVIFEDKKNNIAVFEIDALYRGYGTTIGNALRRVLLSSLPGAAITSIKIEGVSHEFSTISGVMEDVIEIILNLKKVRLKLFSDEPQTLTLKAKGKGKVKAGDIKENANVKIANPDQLIATLTSDKAKLNMELTVEKGIGYETVEERKKEKSPIGTIFLDAVFSPIRKVSYEVENMRVKDKTDFNKIKMSIETDGTITPKEALAYAAKILNEHFEVILNAFSDVKFDQEEKKTVKAKKKK